MASGESLCTCGQPYDPSKFMIQCDICKDWLHGLCVGLREHQGVDVDKYHCPRCELMCGPSIYKQRTNWHRHDPYEFNPEGKPVQTGTHMFIRELRSRNFESGDEVVLRLRGQQLTLPYLAQHGWDRPILVDSPEGLGMQMPPADAFTVHDVENYVGSERELEVVDVPRQRDVHLTMHELADYFSSAHRSDTINCISLEFSTTGLSTLVEPPHLVRKLCWVTSLWPTPNQEATERPSVSKYVLMSAADSYTDFHIDFGGTSVWYHVLQGEKVFYLIRPTASNLTLYQRWLNSPSRNSTFFADQVDACHRLPIRTGQTLFIPSGWIHAVYTPVDSLAFGGNFLCSLNVPLQLRVYDLEKKTRMPLKFRFPSFETCHWLGGRRLLEEMRDYGDANQRCPGYLVTGARSLAGALRVWAHDASSVRRGVEPIPASINANKLIRLLNKEIRHAEKYGAPSTAPPPPRPERESRRVPKRRTLDDDFVDITERADFESLLRRAAETTPAPRKRPAQQPRAGQKLAAPRPLPAQRAVKAGRCWVDPQPERPPPPPPDPHRHQHQHHPQTHGLLKIKIAPRLHEQRPPEGPDEDDDEAKLTIDEAVRRYGRIRSVSMENPLKLRLSVDGRAEPPATRPAPASNGIEELLRASSVADGRPADGRLQPGQASPATRDAIVGMLSMSGAVVAPPARPPTPPGPPADQARRVRSPSLSPDEEAYGTAQDEDYVYPTLEDTSDDEHVFKPRGRRRNDETWSPKARVHVGGERGARPPRDGARREAVDRALGRTAARGALLHSPKKYRSGSNKLLASSAAAAVVVQPSTSAAVAPPSVRAEPGRRPKPKKGMATAKQRLGKILKLNKMKF